MEIRQASEQEVETFVDVYDRLWPNHLGLAELRRDLLLMPEKQKMQLWIAWEGEAAIGVARVFRLIGAFHPLKWFGEIGILEQHRGLGHGRQLYDHVLAFLRGEDAIQVTGRTRDDDERTIEFLRRRGFAETKRDFESVLDLKTLDTSRLDALDSAAFDIRTAKDADSESFRRQWHLLFEEVRKDIPRDDPPTPFSFEEFSEIFFEDEELLWDVSMFAFEGDELIGMSLVYEMDRRGVLFQALTAVRRDRRGMGLAKALKARAMRRAMECGFHEVNVDNDTRNGPMISINERLGYRPKPGMVAMRKVF